MHPFALTNALGLGHEQAFEVLGVRVDAVEMNSAIGKIERWIQQRQLGHYVAVTGMHGIGEAKRHSCFREILNTASIVLPDGMPLVWLARRHGIFLHQRVCGPDLLEDFCRRTGARYRHFFYGGAPGIAEDLARSLSQRTGIIVAGTYTPPFRALTDEEECDVSCQVQTAAPDIVWIGLSTPKQERWMCDHRALLGVPVMVGVGAAFDIAAGRSRRAPQWMQRNGLEWFYRFCREPRRLWKRYLLTVPAALWSVVLEELNRGGSR